MIFLLLNVFSYFLMVYNTNGLAFVHGNSR